LSVAHWENYYRGGALATCPMGPGSGYTLEMREVWLAFFSNLPDGAKVLDVGTGNGIIALFAKEAAGAVGRHYEIHGTDLAQIDPVRDVRDGACAVHRDPLPPRVPTERLPFGPGTFVAVSGHYALEYTQFDASLLEIFRVLKPGGRAQFIVHHAGSVLVRNAHESLRQSDLVLNDTKVFRKLRRHLEAERRSAAAARATWQQLVEAVTLLRRTAAQVRPALTLDITVDAVGKTPRPARGATSGRAGARDRPRGERRAGIRAPTAGPRGPRTVGRGHRGNRAHGSRQRLQRLQRATPAPRRTEARRLAAQSRKALMNPTPDARNLRALILKADQRA
jgi:SAM-dependent methyltransferase